MHNDSKCHGCEYRGMSEMIFWKDGAQYLTTLDDVLANKGVGDPEEDEGNEMDDDSSDVDLDMASGAENENELVIRWKCDSILDIVPVGEVHSFPAHFLVCILCAHSHLHHLTLNYCVQSLPRLPDLSCQTEHGCLVSH